MKTNSKPFRFIAILALLITASMPFSKASEPVPYTGCEFTDNWQDRCSSSLNGQNVTVLRCISNTNPSDQCMSGPPSEG